MNGNRPKSTNGSCCLDEESGLFHQDHFRSVLSQELARLDRWERPLALVILELPHPEAETWAVFGSVLKNSLRRIDLPARLSGRRAAVILPDADTARVRRWFLELLAELERAGCGQDILCGRALARPWEGCRAEELLARAEADLGREDLSGFLADEGDFEQESATAIASDERNLLFAGFKTLGGGQNH